MKTQILFVLMACFLGINELKAQLTISGEVRPRAEFRNGFKTLKQSEEIDPAFFVEQRSRLYVDYVAEKYKFKLVFQDVRIWGEVNQIFKEDIGSTFISEAWGQYYFNSDWSIKFGRQIISYDNQRFLGGLEWAQQGRRHDALLLIYNDTDKKSRLDFGLAFNQDDDIPEPALLQGDGATFFSGNNYKYLQYGWYHKDFSDGKLSVLALNAGYQNGDSTLSNKQTFGLIGNKKFGNVALNGDLYYQTGEFTGRDVNAMLFGINATFKTSITPITIGYESISGTDADDTSGEIRNFSPDFGTNHAFNGLMDYFFVGPANGNVGVQDFYLKTKFKAGKGALLAHVHGFLTGSTQFNSETGDELSKYMGTEIDLVYNVNLDKDVNLKIGYSQMFGSDALEGIRGGDASLLTNWAWTQITIKPTLFKSKK